MPQTEGQKRYAAYKSTSCDREAAAKCGMEKSAFAKWRQANDLKPKGKPTGRSSIGIR